MFMSLILRHAPEKIDIVINTEGWTSTEILIEKLKITIEELDWILANNKKDRFSYNSDKSCIRANQGHSLDYVQIEFQEVSLMDMDLPNFVYHGTAIDLLDVILSDGIKKMSRTHVHLSRDIPTAISVGKRKNVDIILLPINVKQFLREGNRLFISKNGVYLTNFVEPKFIDVKNIINSKTDSHPK